jgi:hypothetical protein
MGLLLTILPPALLLGAAVPRPAADRPYLEALVFSVSDGNTIRGDEPQPQQFQTTFVGLLPDGSHESLEYPRLIVPREEAFVDLSIVRECRTEEPQDLICAESVRVAPFPSTEAAAGQRREEYPRLSDYDHVRIVFVSPQFVGTYRRLGAIDGPPSWNWSEDWSVHRLESDHAFSSEPTRFSDLFGAAGRAAYQAASVSALNHNQGSERPLPQDEECSASASQDTGWTVRRSREGWVARLMQQKTPLCQPEADLAVPVGRRLTGQDDATLRWDEATKAVPYAQEAFGSPYGGLALVASAGRIEVFDRRTPRWRLLASGPRAPIVAVQWSRGAEAGAWRRELRVLRPTCLKEWIDDGVEVVPFAATALPEPDGTLPASGARPSDLLLARAFRTFRSGKGRLALKWEQPRDHGDHVYHYLVVDEGRAELIADYRGMQTFGPVHRCRVEALKLAVVRSDGYHELRSPKEPPGPVVLLYRVEQDEDDAVLNDWGSFPRQFVPVDVFR